MSSRSEVLAPVVPAARFERTFIVFAILLLAAGAVLLASVACGAVHIAPERVIGILAGELGLGTGTGISERERTVVMIIRLPRLLTGFLVGGGLAVAGALMQALFRNPLADPGLIGVSSGAALGAVSVIVLGASSLGSLTQWMGAWSLPVAAFAGGLATMILIYRLATFHGRTAVPTMLLAGIAVNSVAGACTGFFTYLADDAQLRTLTFWTMGSLAPATWQSLALLAPFLLATLASLPPLSRALNAILLGEDEASHLGIRVEWLKRTVIVLAALVVGAATAICGMIGFIGLVAPHLLRLAVGPDHRFVLPGSAILGGTLLAASDLLARTIVAPSELPIGLVTAAVGAPFFLWLILRERLRSALL